MFYGLEKVKTLPQPKEYPITFRMQILLLSFSILPGVMVKYTRTRPKQNGSLIYFRTKQNELKNWSEVK